MLGLIPVIFQFVPIVIFSVLFFLIIFWVKYLNKLDLKSIGSDICLCAVFIQITLLAMPVWLSSGIYFNIPGHVTVTVLTFLVWLMTVWLLKHRSGSRKRSSGFFHKVLDYIRRQRNIQECFSYILGTFAFTISLMMILNMAWNGLEYGTNQTILLILAIISSTAIGYGGYSLYRYLQNEQYSQSFEKFVNEITRDNVLISIQSGTTQMHDRDPIQPVVDIIRGSIMEGIPGPSIYGLNLLEKSCIELLTDSGLQRSNLNKIALHYITYMDDFGKLALRMDEDEAVNNSIHSIAKIGICAVSRDLEKSVEDILQRLSEYYETLQSKEFEVMKLSVTKGISQVGSAAGAHGMESASLKSGNILDRMGALEVRNRDSVALNEIFTALYHIGNESIVSKQESSIKHIATKLRNIGISSIQTGQTQEALQIVTYLEELGITAASNTMEVGTQQIIWSLKDIGVAYGYQQTETGINMSVNALGNVGRKSSQYQLDASVEQALWSLKEVCRYPITEGMETSIKNSAMSFAGMAELENDKVEKTLLDIKQYFHSGDVVERFNEFEHEYFSARKTAGAR